MPSPKKSELLRRVISETSGIYIRLTPNNEGWNVTLDSYSSNKVFEKTDNSFDVICESVIDFISNNREENKSTDKKKKPFTFKLKE